MSRQPSAPLGATWAPHPISWALAATGVSLDGTVRVYADPGRVLHLDATCRERSGRLTLVAELPIVEVYSYVGWCSCAQQAGAQCTAELGQNHLVLATFGPAFDALRQAQTPANEALVLAALAARLRHSSWPVADALGRWAQHGLETIGDAAQAALGAVVSAAPEWWWYLPEGPRLDVYSDHLNWRHHVITLARFAVPEPGPHGVAHWVLIEAGELDAAVSAYLWSLGIADADGIGGRRRVLVVDEAQAAGLVAWQQASLRHSVFHSGAVVDLGPCAPDEPPQLAEAAARLWQLEPHLVLDAARAALR